MNARGIWQAAYTAGVVLPKPLATCQYWHRSLNPKKLIDVGFSRLQVSRNSSQDVGSTMHRSSESRSAGAAARKLPVLATQPQPQEAHRPRLLPPPDSTFCDTRPHFSKAPTQWQVLTEQPEPAKLTDVGFTRLSGQIDVQGARCALPWQLVQNHRHRHARLCAFHTEWVTNIHSLACGAATSLAGAQHLPLVETLWKTRCGINPKAVPPPWQLVRLQDRCMMTLSGFGLRRQCRHPP